MKIITVIPIARGVFKENLTYFSATDVPAGSIITVPIRSKKVDALVIKSENLTTAKSMLKRSAFSLKKIGEIKGVSVLSEDFLRAVFKMKNYAAANSGNVLSAVLPKIYLDSYLKLELPTPKKAEKGHLKQEKLIIQNPLSERLSYYKTFIREAFARKKSVFLILPTIRDAEFFEENLKKGVENYSYIFHNEIPKKEFVKKFNALSKEDHPVLVIATPPYLFLLNNKFGAVVVEHESSSAYKMPSRPYLDMRTWAEIITAEYNIKLILADSILRIETLWRIKNYELSEAVPASFRLPNENKKELVDMKTGKKFSILSDALIDMIGNDDKSNKKTFLFCSRKGLGNITICNDCNSPLLCKSCSKPFVLYGDEKNRIFMCHHCKIRTEANTKCDTCFSWNLKALGIGTDLVFEEITKKFPKRKIFLLDKERAKTAKAAEKIVEEFYATPGAILIGTEMSLYYMSEKIENVAVVSFDSLFAIPDYKINEKIMHILIELDKYAKESFIIQTRQAEEEVITQFLSGNLSEFVREELKIRQELNYPPFSTLIKITYRGPKNNIEQAGGYLKKLFGDFEPAVFSAFVPKIKNLHVLNVAIKVKRSDWTLPEISDGTLNPNLLSKLISLPAALSVEVDPDSLL